MPVVAHASQYIYKLRMYLHASAPQVKNVLEVEKYAYQRHLPHARWFTCFPCRFILRFALLFNTHDTHTHTHTAQQPPQTHTHIQRTHIVGVGSGYRFAFAIHGEMKLVNIYSQPLFGVIFENANSFYVIFFAEIVKNWISIISNVQTRPMMRTRIRRILKK